MTTANKLTILRVILIPVMIVVIYIEKLNNLSVGFLNLNYAQFIFLILFLLGTLTDFLDGYIARKYNQITTFGKFLDPIADKLLVFVALLYLMLIDESRVPLWSVMIILTREFIVTGIRLIAVGDGNVIAASVWGKYKTAFSMIAIIWMLFNDFNLNPIYGNILYYIAVFLTLYSGLDYCFKNRKSIFKNI
ncbi:MAG: CDP-diacylglycerol--glycerol-3-phosphate 3-phosphatidyltransferase [Acholeplasmataceae bacterium]